MHALRNAAQLDLEGRQDMKVIELLLQFSKLEKRDRELFLENVNRYIFVSPVDQRKLRLTWEGYVERRTAETPGRLR
jgi:hypothetical protein